VSDHAIIKINEHSSAITVRFDSSAIISVAWRLPEKDLIILFKTKPEWAYIYRKVPRETVQEMLLAPSTGRFFDDNIKNRFKWVKVPIEQFNK
jgi:hypothetical protein